MQTQVVAIQTPTEMEHTAKRIRFDGRPRAPTVANVRVNEWVIGPHMKNSHNALFCPISLDRTAPKVQLASDSDGLVCPFGLSSWAETDRKTLNLNVPQASVEIRAFCNALDEKVKAYV